MSSVLLWAAFYGIDYRKVSEQLALTNAAWLIAALSLKSATFLLREFRLWLSLPAPRPAIGITIVIGLIGGGLHTLLPGRGGDLATIPMLKRGAKVTFAEATHAVGMTAALEALAFGALTSMALIGSATAWQGDMLNVMTEIMNAAMSFSFGLLVIFVLGAAIAMRIRNKSVNEANKPLSFIKAVFEEYRKSLMDKRYLSANIVLALIEVWLMVLCFSWGFHALGMDISMPWTIAAIIMGGSAFAAVALPQTYGAGPAAVSLFVLSAVGVEEHIALAYSAVYWLISQVPLIILSIPSIWLYKESIAAQK